MGKSADTAMQFHLQNSCSPYKKTRIFNNRCNQKECKRKELIQIRCDSCDMVFCIKHRHSQDHDCEGRASTSQLCANASTSQLCANAAEKRLRELSLITDNRDVNPDPARQDVSVTPTSCSAEQQNFSNRIKEDTVEASNGDLSEEEALAWAIVESKAEAKKREENRVRLVDATA